MPHKGGIAATLILLVMFTYTALAQNVGIGTTNPHPSAQLDIMSNSKGLLIPRLTTTQRNAISNPAHSLLIFNVDNFCVEIYDSVSGQWLALSCPQTCNPCQAGESCTPPDIDSIVGPTSACSGDTIAIQIYAQGAFAYTWNTPSGWIMLTPGDSAVFIVGGAGIVYAAACDTCGCSYDSIVITQGNAPASVNVTGNTSICILDTLVLAASGPSNTTYYQWSIPSGWTVIGPANGPVLKALASSGGTYTFTVRACNACGCSSPSSITVNVQNGPLTADIIGPAGICLPDTVVYKASYPPGANIIGWNYPSTWQVVVQAGDSIVLVPDTADGYVSVRICDTVNCACTTPRLFVTADSCTTFCKTIDVDSNDYAYSMIYTRDGGFAIAGVTLTANDGEDMFIIKLDAGGNIQWSRIIGGSRNDRAHSIVQTSDGGYVVAGTTYSFGSGNADMYVLKLDANGNIQWARAIGGTSTDWAWSIIQTPDGGYAVAGYTYSFGQGNGDMYVVKLDANGNIQWTKTIGASGDDGAHSIIQTSDGGYAVAGYTYYGTYSDMYIVKLDAGGGIQWAKRIGNTYYDRAYSIVQTSGGDFVLVGFTQISSGGTTDMFIVKLDSAGNVKWARRIGDSSHDHAYAVAEASNGDLVVAGRYGLSTTNSDLYVVKLDSTGNVNWTYVRRIGGSGSGIDLPWSVVLTPDGGLALGGYTNSFSSEYDVYVVRLDKYWYLQPCPGGCQVTTGGTVATVTPNAYNHGSGSTGGIAQPVISNVRTGGTVNDLCQ